MPDTVVNTDSIVETVEIAAPRDRVWHALTDHREFGTWFKVDLDGPFVAGERSTGRVAHAGAETPWDVEVVEMDPPRYFSYRWHPYAVDPDRDYSQEPPTLVEFRLEETGTGTRVTVTESGFDAIPRERMPKAREMDAKGWQIQMRNIKAHVEAGA